MTHVPLGKWASRLKDVALEKPNPLSILRILNPDLSEKVLRALGNPRKRLARPKHPFRRAHPYAVTKSGRDRQPARPCETPTRLKSDGSAKALTGPAPSDDKASVSSSNPNDGGIHEANHSLFCIYSGCRAGCGANGRWAKTTELPRSMEQQTAEGASRTTEWLQKKVRHELVMLPYYSVFDHITYKVDGDRVELAGQVHRPTLKSGAARVVQQIEGVSSVTNNIEVLPLHKRRPHPP